MVRSTTERLVALLLACNAPFACRAILGIEDPPAGGDDSGAPGGGGGEDQGTGGARGGTAGTGGSVSGGSAGASSGGRAGASTGGSSNGGTAGASAGATGESGAGGGDGSEPCTPNPCLNGGECVVNGSTFRCDCTSAFTGSTCQSPRFEGVGVPTGAFSSSATDVSRDGNVVVGTFVSDTVSGNSHAFRFSNSTISALDEPELTTYSSPSAVDENGAAIVGSFSRGAGFFAMVWLDGSPVELQPPNATTVNGSVAYAVNADGSTFVGEVTDQSGNRRAVRWSGAPAEGLADLIVTGNTTASAISADGAVIAGHVQSSMDGTWYLARWTSQAGAWYNMPEPANSVYPSGVSDDGFVIWGTYVTEGGEYEPFRFVGNNFEDTELPSDIVAALVAAASADGSTAVGDASTTADPVARAFVWTESDGFMFLDDLLTTLGIDFEGFELRAARGVSADGKVIVGDAINSRDRPEGFVVRLP